MKLGRHLDKGFWAVAANVYKALYGIFFMLWVISIYAENVWGTFALIQTTYLTVSQLAVAIAMSPYIKFFYDKEVDLLALQSNALLLMLSFALPVFAVLLLFPDMLSELFDVPELGSLMYFVPLLFIASLGKLLANEICKATHRIKAFFFTEAIYFTLNMVLVLGVYLAHGLVTPQDMLVPMTIAYLASSLMGLWLVRRDLRPGFRFHRGLMKRMFAFGKYTFGTVATSCTYQYADIYVVGLFLNMEAVGLLATVKIGRHGFELYRQAMTLVAFPAFSRLDAENRPSDLKALYEKGIYYSTILLLAMVLVLLLGADLLFDVILKKYSDGAPLLRLLALGGLFIGWQIIGESLLYGIGKPRAPFVLRVITAVLNLALNIVLIQTLGVAGAIWASLISGATVAIAITIFVHREIGVSLGGILSRRRDLFYFLRDLRAARRKRTKL